MNNMIVQLDMFYVIIVFLITFSEFIRYLDTIVIIKVVAQVGSV